ncbi:unnamed protein product [Ectocarpus fasciculatus]
MYRIHIIGSDGEFATPRQGVSPRAAPKSVYDYKHQEEDDPKLYRKESYETADDGALMGMVEGISDQDVEDIFSFGRHERCADIERLLDRGIPINVRDEFGNTLLTIACQNGSKRVAKIVLRRGADINSRNHRGNTPLHYCYHYGYGDTLGQYLMSKGADASIRNNSGRPCWDGI